jgi:hypothetical protein
MKTFFETLKKYEAAFASSESPIQFLAVVDSTTMIDLMNKAIAIGKELVFEYIEDENKINPDNLQVTIDGDIVFA